MNKTNPGPLLSRRSAITVVGVAAGAALAGGGAFLLREGRRLEPVEWSGVALGAPSRIVIFHEDPGHAQEILAGVAGDIDRLEGQFSLFDERSALSRLNREGRIGSPDADMVALLGESARISEATGGAFDPTVQPLWNLYVRSFADGGPPARPEIDRALRFVDWRAVSVSAEEVALREEGMALTLNGIAQGYITDRVADRLRAGGLRHVLVELGETAGIGAHPDGRPWRIGIPDPDGQGLVEAVELGDEAMATSGGYGTPFDEEGGWHHIFDPRSGLSSHRHRSVTVLAPTATEADALATAFAVMPEERAVGLVAAREDVRVIVVGEDGAARPIGA